METLTLIRPDDWHLHLRDGDALRTLVPHSARRFARALVMPNLRPPVTTVARASEYRRRILDALPPGADFDPRMALYLTESTTADEVRRAAEAPHVLAFKLYPAGATTHSQAGVTDLRRVYPVLAAMQKFDLPLTLHGEVSDPRIDIFDREKAFIDTHLTDIVTHFPELRVVFEHASTAEAVQFVAASSAKVAATITPHHLLFNRNHLLAGGIRPHHYCLPVLKGEPHRQALVGAATSGNPRFFLGTDSAPHPRSHKESACGSAGCYSAHAALELYAEAFEAAGALVRLEAFASRFGAEFYRLARNQGSVTLRKEAWRVPPSYPLGEAALVPLKAGDNLAWRIIDGPP